MATDGQRLRAKAHALPRGHNSKQYKCYDIFVFFSFKGKHFHSPSQQVSQNIFAVRVARVIVSKKTSLLFSNTSPLSAKTSLPFFPTRHSPPTPPLAADFLPRRCAHPSHAHTRTRPHHRVSHFLPSPFTPPYKTLSTNNLQPQKRVNIRPKKPSHHLHQTTSGVSAHDRG